MAYMWIMVSFAFDLFKQHWGCILNAYVRVGYLLSLIIYEIHMPHIDLHLNFFLCPQCWNFLFVAFAVLILTFIWLLSYAISWKTACPYLGSFAGLGFLAWYMSGKIRAFDRRGHVAKLCIVFAPILLAAMVAVSRVDDYWHHWQDVFAGGLIGL